MSEVLREGVIRISLVGGKVEIPTPNLGPVLKAREEELKLVDQLEVATLKAWEAQDKLTKAAADDAAARALQQQEAAQGKLQQSAASLAGAYQQMGAGVFRLSRAFVLLGSDSDESFQRMIQNLAYVQAGFDLFKGAQQIVKGLTAAELALAAATALETQATNVNTVAHVANEGAKVKATAASLAAAGATAVVAAVTNPVVLAIAALGSVIMTAVEAWDYFTESAEEAAAATERYAAMTERLVGSMQSRAAMEREVAAIRREAMDPGARADDLGLAGARAIGGGKALIDVGNIVGGSNAASELQFRKAAQDEFRAAEQFRKQEIADRKQTLDQEMAIRDEKIRQIDAQEKLVAGARQQLQIEKDKVRSFQEQAGSLSTLEQNQLKQIAAKLKAGQEISRFDEEQLARNGGLEGQGIVSHRNLKRGQAAGFDENTFAGIPGANLFKGLTDATREHNELLKQQLADLKGRSVNAAIAALEQEKEALRQGTEAIVKQLHASLNTIATFMEKNAKRIAELEASAAANAG